MKTASSTHLPQSVRPMGATTARFRCESKVDEVTELRRKLQYAADAAWPSMRSTSAGIRAEFKLPKNRALK